MLLELEYISLSGGYMDFEEMKKIELGILDFIVDICNKNNIQYYLAAGTLLGAVRHSGFIPWDDDIDLYMPRDDYMKFIEVTKKTNGKYKVLSIYGSDDYYYPFIKVVDTHYKVRENNRKDIKDLSIWVDIFPLDYDIERKYKNKLRNIQNKFWVCASNSFYEGKSKGRKIRLIIKKLAFIIFNKKNPRDYAKKIEKILLSSNSKNKAKLFVGFSSVIDKETFETEWFEKTIQLTFEGKNYSAPEKFDNILTRSYGRYMDLPPETERVSHHDFVFVNEGERC